MDPGKKQRKAAQAEAKRSEQALAAQTAATQQKQAEESKRQAALDADKQQRANLASNLLFGASDEALGSITGPQKKKTLG